MQRRFFLGTLAIFVAVAAISMVSFYQNREIYVEVDGWFTSTAPVDAYRGAGRPEATYVVERLVTRCAWELGLSQDEIRKRNFITQFPYQTPVALQYDIGDYHACMNDAQKLADVAGFDARRQASEAKGLKRGIGYSSYIEACGLAPSNIAGALGARAGQDACMQAVLTHGGFGYAKEYHVERLLRDARLYTVYPGGTNEVLRCYIALNGLAGPGEQLARLADAIKFPLRGYGLVVETLVDKVRSAAYGRAILARHHPRLKREAVVIEDTIESLTREVDRVLRRHGRFIAEMQYVQRRVANVVIDLYAMCASVSRASAALYQKDARGDHAMPEAGGELDRAERELRLCIGFCSRASTRITETLARFTQNDDELMKSIADDCYIGQPYPFDAVL